MLSVAALNQYYGSSHTLRNIAFEAPTGAITVVLGRNGVGKTTLLKCLAGLLPVRSGSVRFEGVDVTKAPAHARARLGMGYAPQGREIFPRLSVEENLKLGLATRPAGTAIPQRIFEMFPVLADMLHRRGGDLSGGQQQQLAIGRALASNPKLLVLDEPTEGIQPSIIKDIARLLRDIRSIRNLCIVVCEQVLSFVLDIADRIFVMEGGRIVHTDSREHVDEAAIARFLAV